MPERSPEYKVIVSERIMVTTNEHYLLLPAHHDSHASLLVKEPASVKHTERKEYLKTESLVKKSQSRKERQNANKAKSSGRTPS